MKSILILLPVMGLSSFAWSQPTLSPDGSPSPTNSAVQIEQSPSPIEGRLLEKGTLIPLAQRNIFILPHKLKTETNDKGEFKFDSVPAGEIQIVVTVPGYKRLERNAVSGEFDTVTLYLEKENYLGFETTVIGKKEKRDEAKKSLSQEEFLTLPGANGDPVKAVQNLPGVNRSSGFSSNVIIQGSAPQDTKYNIDGHEIPIVFHFGGLTSVIMPEAVREVEYFSAGYGAEYSRAMGGVISLQTREPKLEGRDHKGFFFVDTLKSGALYEKALDEKSSILISGRYSYVGFVLKQALKDNENVNLTAAPDFADVTTIYNKKLSDSEDFKFVGVASRDTLEFVFKEPFKEDPKIRGGFRNETTFWRLIPQYTKTLDASSKYKLSLGLGQDKVIVDLGDNFFNLESNDLTARGEYEQRLSPQWLSQVGFDNSYSWAKVKLRLPTPSGEGGVSNPFSSSEIKNLDTKANDPNVGLYWRNEIKPSESAWTYIPSLRFDRFKTSKENLLSPRLTIRYLWDDSLTLKAAGGMYYQAPRPQEYAENFGNPDLKSSQAVHMTLGFDKDFRAGSNEGWQWTSGFFQRNFSKLVVSSTNLISRNGETVAEVYSNEGTGFAKGIETQIKYNTGVLKTWLSYTYSESRRSDPRKSNYLFEYDQTHNMNLVAAYDYGDNWQISGRYRYVTGNPYTPIVGGVFDSDNDVYLPTRGEFFSRRNQNFSQLDLRFDKKFILQREVWSIYLDIQNILNSKNIESRRYSFDYSQEENVAGLPFLPSLGLKGEF